MRTIKLIVILLLVTTAVVFGITFISEKTSGKNEGPVISCASDILEVSVLEDTSVLLTGVTAKDAQDGDLTDQILLGGVSKLITDNTAKVTYLVFDSDDNMASFTRYIRYTDYSRPVFDVTESLTYATAEAVLPLERITATDVIDGDISASVRISTLRSTDTSEVYLVTAQVTNSMGDTARVELPVIVQDSDTSRPVIHLKKQLVYLDAGSAFDPGSYLRSVKQGRTSLSVSDVDIDNQVNVMEAGTYYVTYTYSGDWADAIAILTVVVS